MSKLSDAIEVQQTGRVKMHPQGFGIKVEEELRTNDYSQTSEYHLGVVLEMRGYAENPAALRYVKEVCKRSIIQEVFGEFRPMLLELERAIAELKLEEARLLIQNIHNEMFSS